MSTTVTIHPAVTVTIDNIKILAVRDIMAEKKIIARIDGIPSGVVLWEGEEEYSAAGNWTDESVLARATEVLSSGTIKLFS